jgi:prepilin-type N-terminal cleavage/methylation domain-containing protein
MKHIIKKEAGVTLIELMIVLALASVVMAAIYATFISQQKSYATQTQVSDLQQNARAALILMERDLRMAAFGVGDMVNNGFIVQGYDGTHITNITNAITVTNNAATPDQITVVYAAQLISNVTGVSGNTVTLGSVTGLGTANGQQYIAFETVTGLIYTIQSVTGNTLNLNTAPPDHLATLASLDPTGAPITGARAYLVEAITYQVNNNTLWRVASNQIGTNPNDNVGNYITNLKVVWPFNGSNNLIQVTITGQETDTEGTVRTRQYQTVIDARNY